MKHEDVSRRDPAAEPAPSALPDSYEGSGSDNEHPGEHDPSLIDDVVVLFEDGKTYVEAEIAYQKSRAGFTANRVKKAVGLGAAAFGVFHLALIAIAVGLVIALVPLVGPWLATLIVGGLLIVAGILLLRALKGQIDDIRDAFDEGSE